MFVIILTILYSLIFLFIIGRFLGQKVPEKWRNSQFSPFFRTLFAIDEPSAEETESEAGKPREEDIILR